MKDNEGLLLVFIFLIEKKKNRTKENDDEDEDVPIEEALYDFTPTSERTSAEREEAGEVTYNVLTRSSHSPSPTVENSYNTIPQSVQQSENGEATYNQLSHVQGKLQVI